LRHLPLSLQSLLADGSPKNWNLFERHFGDEFGQPFLLIDFWHVIEKLSLLFGDVVVAQSAWTREQFQRQARQPSWKPDSRAEPRATPVLNRYSPSRLA
jgi:hypothetical protein